MPVVSKNIKQITFFVKDSLITIEILQILGQIMIYFMHRKDYLFIISFIINNLTHITIHHKIIKKDIKYYDKYNNYFIKTDPFSLHCKDIKKASQISYFSTFIGNCVIRYILLSIIFGSSGQIVTLQNKFEPALCDMRTRKVQKQQNRQSLALKQKTSSQQQLKVVKERQKDRKKQNTRLVKKTSSKTNSRQNQTSFKNSLFASLQDLPVARNNQHDRHLTAKQESKPITSLTKFQDTNTSRQPKFKGKQYSHPNGEYFGNRPGHSSVHARQKQSSRSRLSGKSSKLSKSLQGRIKQLRSIESLHHSQSQSLKSQVSDQEMRRLKKIHSLEKMKLMEEIIGIEERIIHSRRSRK